MRRNGVREISRITGLSPATVSNALSGNRRVSKATEELVKKAAQELNIPSSTSIERINFVLMRKTGEVLDEGTFHPGVIEGVEKAASAQGLTTVFTTVQLSDTKYAKDQVREILRAPKTGVVVLATEMQEEDFDLFQDAQAPLVMIDGWSDRLYFECVVTANESSAHHAVRYLIEHGHTHIGYIAGAYRIKNFPLREKGYLAALAGAGISPKKQFRVEVGTTVDTAHAAMSAWLDRDPELPTAFFVENDIMALGCMRALTERGIKVPDEVSMFGFDDLNFAKIANPPLTTVHLYNREMGEIAVQNLLGRLQHPTPYTLVTHLSATLVERQSVKTI